MRLRFHVAAMQTPETLNPQYVTDAEGRRTGVLLSIDAFEALVSVFRAVGESDPAEAAWRRAARQAFADLATDDEGYAPTDGVPFHP